MRPERKRGQSVADEALRYWKEHEDFASIESPKIPAVLPPPSKPVNISLLDMMREAVFRWRFNRNNRG